MKTEKPNNIVLTEDEIKFKNEYEKLNGINYTDEVILKSITIENDNNVKYVTDDEIINLLQKGTNVIYFGWAECNWCRSIVPTLIETLKENEIETLYYYDFKALRTAYENDSDKNKVEIYEKILKIIGKDITSVFNEDSNKSGEKKILAPTVVFIKDGNYIGSHIKSVDSQLQSSDELSKEQLKELKSNYEKYVTQLNLEICIDEGC